MPSEPVPDINIPAPWAAFLGGLDSLVPEPVALHCIGGFVLTVLYGVPRVTSDLDCVAILPHHDPEQLLVAARLLPRSTGFICSTSL